MAGPEEPRADLAKADRAVMLALQEPIPQEAIDTRPGRGGKQFRYITAETLMERLDRVVGPENWSNEVQVDPKGGWVRQTLTITLPSGKVIMRSGLSDLVFEDERGNKKDFPFKSGDTDALKRAGQRAGVARDLYEDDAGHGDYDRPAGQSGAPARNGSSYGQGHGGGGWGGQGGGQQDGPPRNGRQLYGWASKEPRRRKWFDEYARLNALPDRYTEWTDGDVAEAIEMYQEKVNAAVARGPAREPAPGRQPAPAAAPARGIPVPSSGADDEDDIPF